MRANVSKRANSFLNAAALAAACWLLAEPIAAQSFPAGSGTLQGGATVKVRRCDRLVGGGTTLYTVDAAGVFTENPADPIVGTLSQIGGNGRKFSVTYDAANTALIEDLLESFGSASCGASYTLSSARLHVVFKLNKRHTRAVVRQRAKFAGTTPSGKAHKGKFRAADRGRWDETP